MTDREETYAKILSLIEPFNKKGAEVGEATRFQQDLEWDSLTVMDFVAAVEDEFDIIISMNQRPRSRPRPAGRCRREASGREMTDGIEKPRAAKCWKARATCSPSSIH